LFLSFTRRRESVAAREVNEMEALVYAANILYLLSYLVRDILHLRLLTVVAACCLVTYFYNQPEPLMTVVCWNLFFVALNIVQLTRIIRERLPGSERNQLPAHQVDVPS
jgi:hypothetical protein